jgi:carbonic anhydrase
VNLPDSMNYFSELLESNRVHAAQNQALYAGLKDGQKPKMVIALCSDSRLQTAMFGDSLEQVGKLFVGRDIGNTYEDSAGAVAYAVEHLDVPLVFIMGHTGCGAAAAAASDYSGESSGIKDRLDHLHVTGDTIKDPQHNVDEQVAKVGGRYLGKVSTGQVTVIGGVFDLVGAYGGNQGQIYITNVNGITDVDEMKRVLSEKKFANVSLLEEVVKRV